MTYSKEFLDKTISFWQPYSMEVLNHEDAREIAENMINLFRYINELDVKHGAQKIV